MVLGVNAITLADQLRTPEAQVKMLQGLQVLPTSHTCTTCNTTTKEVRRKRGTKYFYFRCNGCRCQTSIRDGTLLSEKGIAFRTFFLIGYFFVAMTMTHHQLIHEVNLVCPEEEEEGGQYTMGTTITSCHTTVHYNKIFRDIIAEEMFNSSQDQMIGGPGTTVEVDESMFGKRKYQRGRITGRRQCWILGGVCRESKECFLEECPDNKRDRKTLEGLIVKRIRPGTRILTDKWSSYKRLEHLGCSNVAIDLSMGLTTPKTSPNLASPMFTRTRSKGSGLL